MQVALGVAIRCSLNSSKLSFSFLRYIECTERAGPLNRFAFELLSSRELPTIADLGILEG